MTETDALIEAVHELRIVVQDLTQVMREDYPKRTEVEQRFTTKETSKNRFLVLSAAVIIAVTSSYFVTIATVSSCFLGDAKHPQVCHIMPGYPETLGKSQAIIDEFRELQDKAADNTGRIEILEKYLLEGQSR